MYALIISIEEVFEMLGVIILIYASMTYLQSISREIHLRIG